MPRTEKCWRHFKLLAKWNSNLAKDGLQGGFLPIPHPPKEFIRDKSPSCFTSSRDSPEVLPIFKSAKREKAAYNSILIMFLSPAFPFLPFSHYPHTEVESARFTVTLGGSWQSKNWNPDQVQAFCSLEPFSNIWGFPVKHLLMVTSSSAIPRKDSCGGKLRY